MISPTVVHYCCTSKKFCHLDCRLNLDHPFFMKVSCTICYQGHPSLRWQNFPCQSTMPLMTLHSRSEQYGGVSGNLCTPDLSTGDTDG